MTKSKISENKTKNRRQYTLDLQKNKDAMNTKFEEIFGVNSIYYTEFTDQFDQKQNFSLWKKFFANIYHDEQLSYDLYTRHNYLFLILNIAEKILIQKLGVIGYNDKESLDEITKYSNKIACNIFQPLKTTNSFQFQQIKAKIKEKITDFFMKRLNSSFNNHEIENKNQIPHYEDIFNIFYQELIIPNRRHRLGEFYTPKPLAERMIKKSYQLGDRVLDPACGTGTFLTVILNEIFEKYEMSRKEDNQVDFEQLFKSLSGLYGVEINPLTALVARLNLMVGIIMGLGIFSKSSSVSAKEKTIHLEKNLSIITNNIINSDFIINQNALGSSSQVVTEQKLTLHDMDFDLIIGNPPWLVINGVHSLNYKESLKKLAKELYLKTSSQNTSNLELSSLFFAKSVRELLVPGGKIHFVTSAGLMNGSQNDKLRRFDQLKGIELWVFNKDLFNIHNICVYGEKINKEDPILSKNFLKEKYQIQVCTMISEENPIKYSPGPIEEYIPSYFMVDKKKMNIHRFLEHFENESKNNIDESLFDFYNQVRMGRLVKKDQNKNSEDLTQGFNQNNYRDLFRQGACLGPRNLIFCEYKEIEDSPILEKYYNLQPLNSSNFDINSKLVEIKPDLSIQYKKYGKWDFKAYESAIIEEKYLFNCAKSTNLIPFLLLKTDTFFMPVDFFKDYDWSRDYAEARRKKIPFQPDLSNSKITEEHYRNLEKIYKTNMKSGVAIDNLIHNMNHNNKLFNSNQRSKIKLIYNGIGSIVKSSLISGEIVVDSSLYYFVPKNIREAYYLMGILNSPIITDLVKQMGSTGANGSLRNIHKNPLDIGFPDFKNTKIQQEIINSVKELENFVLKFVATKYTEELNDLITENDICPKCGKFFKLPGIDRHISNCKKNKDFSGLREIFNKIESKSKLLLIDKKFIASILEELTLNQEKGKALQIYQNHQDYLNLKKIVYSTIKPKKIQMNLRKNQRFLILIERLNQKTIELLKEKIN